MRFFVPVLAAIAIAAAACGDDDASTGPGIVVNRTPVNLNAPPEPFPFNTPEARTPYPGVAPGIRSFDGAEPLPPLPEGAAVYLSLGDSLNWGCCADPELSSHPRFAHYLSERLNRQVVWVSLAGNGTLRSFLNGGIGNRPQLDVAEETIERLREEGHDIVAITLSIGGNDVLELRTVQGCTGGSRPECVGLFQDLVESYAGDMYEVYERLRAAKDPATPVLQNNYYDAMDCSQPGADITTSAVVMGVFNSAVYSATMIGGGFPVDFETAFKGHACEYISGVDPTYPGYDVILDLHIGAYEALPEEYVERWER